MGTQEYFHVMCVFAKRLIEWITLDAIDPFGVEAYCSSDAELTRSFHTSIERSASALFIRLN